MPAALTRSRSAVVFNEFMRSAPKKFAGILCSEVERDAKLTDTLVYTVAEPLTLLPSELSLTVMLCLPAALGAAYTPSLVIVPIDAFPPTTPSTL